MDNLTEGTRVTLDGNEGTILEVPYHIEWDNGKRQLLSVDEVARLNLVADNSIKEEILKRINEIKDIENDFSKSLMRWANVEINGEHISKVDFSALNDIALVNAFENITKRFYRQM